MDYNRLKSLLEMVQAGKLSVENAMQQLKKLPYEDLGFAKPDLHRSLRKSTAEVVFCPGKSLTQIVKIFEELAEHNPNVMATRASVEVYAALKKEFADVVYHELPKLIVLNRNPLPPRGDVVVVSAGTADLPVAEEAAITATVLGSKVTKIYDVGVAGLHRLLDYLDILTQARVLVVVAGMEGALASVIGGIVKGPVIAVPTSIGYGASFNGLAALLSMLNSCATGVSVVNIDNGFGAGYLAHQINMIGESL